MAKDINIERMTQGGETLCFSENLPRAGSEPARQAAAITKHLAITPRHHVMKIKLYF